MLLTALLLSFPCAQATEAPTYQLPPGPVAERLAAPDAERALAAHRAALAALAEAGQPAQTWAGLGSWDSPAGLSAWSDSSGWTWWRELLTDTLTEPAAGERSRHYWLAQLARAQGRDDDVWTHLGQLELGELSDALAVLIPGHAGPLPEDGPLLLSPLLPPIPVYDPMTWQGLPPLREYVVDGLRIGESTLSMTVSMPREGVEVRLTHRSGPALDLAVHIPTPPEARATLEYLDWERIEEAPFAHAVLLEPGSEERILWARCLPADLPWPKLTGSAPFPPGRELVIETTADDPDLPQVAGFAEALDALLENRVVLRQGADPRSPAPQAGSGLSPLRIDLRPGPRRLDKLRAILSQVERYVLERG